MAAKVHGPLRVIAFNENGIWRQHHKLSNQLQDVGLLAEAYLRHHETFFIPNYHFYWTDSFLGRNGRTAVAGRKGIPP
jgi:hypothetical protein